MKTDKGVQMIKAVLEREEEMKKSWKRYCQTIWTRNNGFNVTSSICVTLFLQNIDTLG